MWTQIYYPRQRSQRLIWTMCSRALLSRDPLGWGFSSLYESEARS